MKKTSNILKLLVLLILAACQNSNENMCTIHGTLPNDNYEGKRIFLVQLSHHGPGNEGVDSVEVHNRQFEFKTTRNEMASLRMDYHFRYGLQELLVVEEPGTVNVVIAESSSASGTPQNDSLQVWKQKKELYDMNHSMLRKASAESRKAGDSIQAKQYSDKGDSVYYAFRDLTLEMAERQPEGPLKNFLNSLYSSAKK